MHAQNLLGRMLESFVLAFFAFIFFSVITV